jgi:YbbR domain-containing protein
MKDLGLKLTAVVLACVVWWYVSAPRRERVRERIFSAPLSILSLAPGLVITTEIPESVDVRLRGRSSDLRRVSSQTLEVPVDLSWIQQPGEVEITLRPQAINVDPNIEVVSIARNKFRFRVEPLRQRAVPIRPFLDGQLHPGYRVGELVIEPDRVLISGPASQILKTTEVTTERIIMTDRTETFVQNVAVVSDSPLVRVISPLAIQVTVPVLTEIGPEPPPSATDTTATTATTTTTTRTQTP